MAKSSKKAKKNIFKKYSDAKAHGNIGVSAMKMAVEGVVAASAGAGVGALTGKWSALVGVISLGIGEYLGDDTNLSKAAAAGMIGYGIGSAVHSNETAKSINGAGLQGFGAVKEGAKQRLMHFKDGWMKAFFLDKIVGAKDDLDTTQTDDGTVGAIDMSEFDVFEDLNRQEAIKFEEERAQAEEFMLDSGEDETDDLPIQEDEYDQLLVQEIDALDGNEYAEVDFSTF